MSGNPQNETKRRLDSIPEAIEAIKRGEVIIVVDDEDRENEGDFLAAAEKVSPEMINFMATHGRGLICTPIVEKRCEELDLHPMVMNNTDPHHTAFTVSVDLIGQGNTTGISAADRARTIQALVNPNIKPSDLARPGHIFPLTAKQGGVLRRTGHTEAAIDLARLAGFQPAGVIVEIMNEDGSMARLPQLFDIADKFGLKIISIEDLVAYRMANESLIEKVEEFEVPTPSGNFTLHAYKQTTNGQIHLALTTGHWQKDDPVVVRMHSAEVGSDIFSLIINDSSVQLHKALAYVQAEGKGAVVYLNQQGNSDVLSKIQSYKARLKDEGTAKSFTKDPKDIGIGAQILHDLNISKVKLLTNNPIKRVGIVGYGLEIVENLTYN